MRITGGTLRGRIVKTSRGKLDIRPAMDRMRESVFSIIAKDLPGKSFVDLFSGSGIIALEAASRGASKVSLCEKDRDKAACILENVKLAGAIGIRIDCHFISAERFILRNRTPYDFAFLDPPFAYRYRNELLESASSHNLISKDGLLMIHFPAEADPGDTPGGLTRVDRRTYGRSVVGFYKYASPAGTQG